MMNTTHHLRTSDAVIPQDGDRYWQAVLAHDSSFDGSFFYAVRSTGIYCRPSCPSRRPRKDQVTFYSRAEAAEQAGFRPCRRCGKEARDRDRATTLMVTNALGALDAAGDGPSTLAGLGRELRVPPHRLARGFKKITGITPREYLQARQIARFKTALRSEGNVTTAVYEAGYGSSRAAYEGAPGSLGMTPGAYHRGGAGKRIGYTIVHSPLGRLLIAATERGLCSVCLGDSDAVLEAALFREYPKADIRQDNTGLRALVDAFHEHLSGRLPKLDLPLDIKATIFQQSVWRELGRIPYGETRSYSDVALAIGRPRAVRAVARACATNPVAIAIPCHRVVGKDEKLAGYRWGLERKRVLLDREKEEVSLPNRGDRGADLKSLGRILAIDFGLVRFGLAVSDSLGITAQGLATLERRNKQTDFRTLGELANEYLVARIIVGNPIGLSGEETEMSRRVAKFADELGSRLEIPVELWDERFSSAEADRSLRESGADGRKRRQARDRVAAQILLQSYLDRRAFGREH